MSKSYNPQNGYLLIEPTDVGESMAGNIILPDLGKEKPAQGKILATSLMYNNFKGTWVASEYQIGDEVLIPRMGSQRVTVDDKEYYLCKFTEVLLVIK